STHAADSGTQDGFIARLSADLTVLRQATYLGASDLDQLLFVGVHPISGDIVVAGNSRSTNFPCTHAGGSCADGGQPTNHGIGPTSLNAIAARLTPDLTLADSTPSPFAFQPVNNALPSTLITSAPAQVNGLFGPAPVYVDGAQGSAYCVS